MFGMSISSVSSIVTKQPRIYIGQRVYSLYSNIAVLPDASGNITSVCVTDDCLKAYLSVNNGNVYVCDITNNNWTKSTGNTTFYRRTWRDIVCSSTGQYVCCVLSSATLNDPSGIIFYSTDYGNTFTNSQFTSSVANAFAPNGGGIGINLAMNSDGSSLYYAHNSSSTAGYLYKSTDYGNTWSLLVTAATAITVKTNNTGQYVIYGGNMITQISLDYGATWRNTGSNASATPKYFSNIDINLTGILQFYAMTYSSGSWNAFHRSTYNVSNNVISNSNINPFIISAPPGGGCRYVASVNKQQILLVADVPPSTLNGNIYITTNGAASLAQGSNGNAAIVDFSNFSSSQGIGQSSWTGLKANYNDSIIFSNKVGKIFLYTWSLQ
jgi:hypothetical protein